MSVIGGIGSLVENAFSDPGAIVKDVCDEVLPKNLAVVGDAAAAYVDVYTGHEAQAIGHGVDALEDLPQLFGGPQQSGGAQQTGGNINITVNNNASPLFSGASEPAPPSGLSGLLSGLFGGGSAGGASGGGGLGGLLSNLLGPLTSLFGGGGGFETTHGSGGMLSSSSVTRGVGASLGKEPALA